MFKQCPKSILISFLASTTLSLSISASEPPRLPVEFKAETLTNAEQRKVPFLKEAYVSLSPKDLNDGIQVGKFDIAGADQAIKALVADDKAKKYDNLNSLLLWKDGKLLFEMYSRTGRVDAPHYTMSVTKTLTSVTLARAIQCGLLDITDLDKTIVSFMPEIDRSKIAKGVESITLRDALFMKSGLRFKDKNIDKVIDLKHNRQQYFQQLFERALPITPESKTYKYSGVNPLMILMIIDIKYSGTVQEFIQKEVADKFAVRYNWKEHPSSKLPSAGAGASFTSRALLKFATTVIQGGKYNGEQLLSADYVKLIMDTKKGNGYYYYFHNRNKLTKDRNHIDFISGIGAGGQYMSTYPEQNIVVIATSTNKGNIGAPLKAILGHLLPLYKK